MIFIILFPNRFMKLNSNGIYVPIYVSKHANFPHILLNVIIYSELSYLSDCQNVTYLNDNFDTT